MLFTAPLRAIFDPKKCICPAFWSRIMSIRYSISCSTNEDEWPVSSACLDGVSQLTRAGLAAQLAAVGLEESSQLGQVRHIDRAGALAALEDLIAASRHIPRGFEIFFKHPYLGDMSDGEGCRGASGFRIDGVHYYISCEEDYWHIQPMTSPAAPVGSVVPAGMRGEPRREPAEIETENYGLVKVMARKGRSEVSVLVSRIQKFVMSSPDEGLRVTVG